MRSLLRVAAALVALLLIAVAAILAPPHLQVRRVTPRLPDAGELLALRDAEDGPTEVAFLTVASQASPRGALSHTVALVSWADGRRFMIDAGMDRAGAAEFAELLKTLWGAAEGLFHGDVARQLGAAIQDVQAVGFTHLHIDHTQGVGAFCDARGPGATVYWTRWQAREHNFNTREGAEIVRDSCLETRTLQGEGLFSVEGFPGLGAVALGGHTPGSTLFAVAVDDRLWLFSGDITNSKAALRDDVGKGFVYSGLLVPENTARTAELRRWLGELDARDDTVVVVSHDPEDAAANGLPRYASRPPGRASGAEPSRQATATTRSTVIARPSPVSAARKTRPKRATR